MRTLLIAIIGAARLAVAETAQQPVLHHLEQAMRRIYCLDFPGGIGLAASAAQRETRDPLAPAILAAGHLFEELDRLDLLRDGTRKTQRPDPAARRAMRSAAEEAFRRGAARRKEDARDAQALTALMIAHGVERDYLALVEKSYRQSWVHARQAQALALELIAAHPQEQDAWFTIGFSDYLVARAPFVFRPFMKMDQADGDRRRALRNLEKAAAAGRYLRGFAQMILASAYRQDGRRADAERMLAALARDYPQNKAVRRELGQNSEF